MKDRDIIALMNKLKNDPEFNRPFDAQRSWKLVSERCGFEDQPLQERYGARDYIEFYVWQFTHAIAKPLAVSMAVFLLLIGGWIGVGNASMGTLPGDRLYSTKLTMEKVQMALAVGPEQKAKLQVELASRRLEEMVELSATSYKHSPESVRLAVRQFKKEVQTIRADLKVQTATSGQTRLAREIGRKSTAYQAGVADSSANAPEEIKEEVDEVKALLEQAEDEAVEVIITAHESTEDEATAFELEKAFEKELATVMAFELDDEANEQVELAVALKEQGLYRRAFQVLKELSRASIQE